MVEIQNELEKITIELLFSKFKDLIEEDDVYPGFEDSQEDREYIEEYFIGLKEFCYKITQEKRCLLSYIQ